VKIGPKIKGKIFSCFNTK